ncbi:MAG: LacI family transcriptional regulator [Mongoliibacter sp.]|uniref:LacI family DNA-binding transcriptional regulator n=1 Tax=Mongoliibacter sp. TaxID=2022438 RepID=UPI0012F344CD|nr:LacI family DNA-binding transcriptional regulator [Mongoliibacter sp.]TVP52554.1 MAG: LacI family transcriptional regulator [Mongoliibacter sp.]
MKKEKATIHDIAEKLNVTASTVSRALNDSPRISQATKKLVVKMAKQLNYQPNNIASALRSGKSKLIGVIIPTANRAFFSSVVRGIEEIANNLGYKVIICQSYDDLNKEIETIDALLSARVDGIVASTGKQTVTFDHYQRIIEKGIPLILFDRGNKDLKVSQVVIDDYQGAYQAVKHLIDQGCKRIAHFTSTNKISIYKDRLRGYLDALRDADIPIADELIVESDLQLEDGRMGMEVLLELKERPDAVFSSSDFGAMGAMQVLKEKKINIPEEVALVGFSNEPFTSYTDPPLSSVDQISITMGKITAEAFFDELKLDKSNFIPQRTVLSPQLIIRASSKKNETISDE